MEALNFTLEEAQQFSSSKGHSNFPLAQCTKAKGTTAVAVGYCKACKTVTLSTNHIEYDVTFQISALQLQHGVCERVRVCVHVS